jgi:hypothetical protein
MYICEFGCGFTGAFEGVQAHENECAIRPGKDLETLAHEHALDAQTRVHASKTPRHMKKPARCDQRQMLRQVLNWARLSALSRRKTAVASLLANRI